MTQEEAARVLKYLWMEQDEHGRLIERIEYMDGRVATNGRKAVTA